MNWVAVGAIAEIAGAAGSIAIAGVAVYIGIRQWVDGKRISREQRELTERIERNNDASKLEQERIIRARVWTPISTEYRRCCFGMKTGFSLTRPEPSQKGAPMLF